MKGLRRELVRGRGRKRRRSMRGLRREDERKGG